jgi:hypothetical protein
VLDELLATGLDRALQHAGAGFLVQVARDLLRVAELVFVGGPSGDRADAVDLALGSLDLLLEELEPLGRVLGDQLRVRVGDVFELAGREAEDLERLARGGAVGELVFEPGIPADELVDPVVAQILEVRP